MAGRQFLYRCASLDGCYLPTIDLQQVLELRGQLFIVKRALGGIAQHVDGLVVARCDDITLVVASVKYVERLVGNGPLSWCQSLFAGYSF